MTNVIELKLGDEIRDPRKEKGKKVVVQVAPSINVGFVVGEEPNESLECGFGTLSGPVEIMGRWAVDKLLKATYDAWGERLTEDAIRDHYQEQLEFGPVIYEP